MTLTTVGAVVVDLTPHVIDLGSVALASVDTVAVSLRGAVDLGPVTVAAPVAVAASFALALGPVGVSAQVAAVTDLSQPGTLANPYAAADSDTRSLDFDDALFVPAEPVPATGPPAAPSIWYRFTESQTADWLASTSGFTSGATIELYSGPVGARADDLTFIATDGVIPVDLGALSVGVAGVLGVAVQVMTVDLGPVPLTAAPELVAAL